MGSLSALLLAVSLAASDVPPTPHRLKLSWPVDGAVTGALLVGWGVTEVGVKKQLAPAACRWCDTNGFDTAVRNVFHPDGTPSAFGVAGPDLASNLVGFGALPVAMLGLEALHGWGAGDLKSLFLEDTLIILEATFSGLVLNQAVKFVVGRARPYTTGASPELLATGRDPADHFLSFFSGHSTFAFGLATAAGTVASLRGYRWAWLTWAVGVPLATTTALLRLAADKHWTSDILLGTAVGAAFGVGVPLLFHGREGQPLTALQVSPWPGGVAVSGRF